MTAWAEEAGEPTKGKELFRVNCAICHGEAGAGDGPAAPYLTPRSRDLTREPFKSVTGEDGWSAGVRRVFRKGMPGSAMPRFGALREDEIVALLSFIRSIRPWDEQAQAQAEPTPEERRRLVYSKLQCAQCHGEDGAGDGPSAAELLDDQGRSSYPTDLRRPRPFRGGVSREDRLRSSARRSRDADASVAGLTPAGWRTCSRSSNRSSFRSCPDEGLGSGVARRRRIRFRHARVRPPVSDGLRRATRWPSRS